ncbi:ATP-binding protein [Thermogemmatispora carboxidivorans]|uniref:ATP-binding protein n=1 Tax=Thermogemmatispora carboxidivorans TaxID=1382306 RepID=UPI00069B1DB2|nr:ATP-binding protein [Thermogemmatispora carboxidivorans]
MELSRKALPTWYREFLTLFRSGASHGFILTGDVQGVTALQGISHLRFLQGTLHTDARDIVLTYHRAVGITFALPSMRERALALLEPALAAPAGPLVTALNAGLPAAAAGGAVHQEDLFSSARRPAQALAIIDQLLRHPAACGRVAVILDGVDLICPGPLVAPMSEERLALLATLLYWGQDVSLGRQNNPIFLLSPRLSSLHPDLRANASGYRVIELALPDEATRRAYITWYLQDYRQEQPIALLDLTIEDLARNTAGLNLRQIEDILLVGAIGTEGAAGIGSLGPDASQRLSAGASEKPLEGGGETRRPGVTRQLVKARKDALIRQEYSETVVMLDPLPEGFAGLGGLDTLIAWTRQEVIAPLREGRLRDVPKGVLLVGPPGTGKTRYVEAAAKELGYNAMALRMASILGGVVGTSERNLQAIFDLAMSLAPMLLFIDELDQTHLAQRGSHSGSPVAANLFGALLQWMGDEALRGRVLVVAATNQPHLLDPALLRPGRFDVIFPVLCPDEAGRRSVLQVQARLLQVTLSEEALELLARETDSYSPADLEAVLKEARFLANGSDTSITLTEAQTALENIRPVTLAQVEQFTRRALEACNNLRFLPPALAAQERERRHLARLHQRARGHTREDEGAEGQEGDARQARYL